MGMRNYQPIHISPMLDPSHRNELLKMDKFLRQISANQARVPQAPQGTPSAGGGSVDLSNYLFLPGKPLPGQFAKERVTFEMKSGDEISSTSDSDIRGFTLRHTAASGGIYYNHDVYFSAQGTGANIARRWIFPNFSAGATGDNRVFVSESGTQSITGKIFGVDCKYLFDGSAGGGFFNSTQTKQFNWTFASGFPTTGVQTPPIQLPALDTSDAQHSWVILHSNASSPFPPGSILYGNAAGSEMAALANGAAGEFLISGGTTVAPSWGSSSGGTLSVLKLRIGDAAVPTHRLEIVAGTTTVAPIRLTSGTSLTTSVSGAIEMNTDNLFFTITTGAGSATARKRLLMADSFTGLVSGRVPFATTNGRLTDISTFTFSAGTLTASNLTATGNVTGFLITATSQLDVASFMSARATGLRIGNTSAATFPLDILLSDSYQAVGIDQTNVTESTRGTGLSLSFTDNNADVQSGDRSGLTIFMGALNSAAAGSSLGTISGLNFSNVSTITDQISVGELVGSKVATSVLVTGSGVGSTIAGAYGARYLLDVAGVATTGTDAIGLELSVGASGLVVSRIAGVLVRGNAGYAGATDAAAYDINSDFASSANITNWYGLRIPSISGPGTIWGVYQSGTMDSAIAGNLRIGSTTAPTVAADVTGSIKSSALTSGRVVFSTTGGQLTDDADMTFATDTLTVTKIAATQFTGDVQFTGSGVGLPYGSCYGNEIGWSQTLAGTGTFYEVSNTGMTDGELNNVTHDGSGKLTVTIAGRYLINYSVSLEADAANIHLISAISINGTEISPGRMHFHRAAASAAIPLPGTAIVNLAANDTVEVAVATADAGAPTLSVEHLNISVVQVGG